jgi:tRNA uracil 4-sulfurtransferase
VHDLLPADADRTVISAHYAEIALKGKNRHLFLLRLRNNMMAQLRGEPVVALNHIESRLLLRLADPAAAVRAAAKLQRVPGIQNLSLAASVARTGDDEADLETAGETAAAMTRREVGDARNFKVEARRSDRAFTVPSPQINARLGAAVVAATNLPVNLHTPEFTVHVLVMKKEILVFAKKLPGCGGLPVGSSGRVTVLMSGGIDSPVAAWMMMRRGCRPEFVHFYPGRSVAEADSDKIERLVAALAGFAPQPLVLHLVPSYPYETRAVGVVEDAYDMVLFRRYMFKTAVRFARRENCQAVIAGDSVGQVASQTLPNLAAITPDVRLPILRPLIGMDKLEITALSRRIGVFDISIEPHRDCCSIRSPRPVLNARAVKLLELSEEIGLDEAVNEALLTATKLRIGPAGRVAPGPDA